MTAKTFEQLNKVIDENNDRVNLELLEDEEGKVLAILHYITPDKDREDYVDVVAYRVRTYDEEGKPDLIQDLMKFSNSRDGKFMIHFTHSPVGGNSFRDIEVIFRMFPFLYSLAPEDLLKRPIAQKAPVEMILN